MNYLYDILLNYNNLPYEIFDWNAEDEITHIRKIPFFKVKTQVLQDIVNNKVVLDNEFINKIYKKTEIFVKNRINNITSFVLTDGYEVIAIRLNNNLTYSKLIYDEELEALEYNLNLTDIKYEIIKNRKINHYKTRNEIYMKTYILMQLNKIINDNDIDKLKYIYLEFFNKKIADTKNILQELENNWDSVYLKLYKFLKGLLLKQ